MKILLATDGSECSEWAIRAVCGRPWPAGSELKIVSVADRAAHGTAGFTYVTPEITEMLEAALEKSAADAIVRAGDILRECGTAGLTVSTLVMKGVGAAACITKEAARWGADLVVVGSHGRGAIGRFLLGSVSSGVLSHAPCSVEVIRCSRPSEP